MDIQLSAGPEPDLGEPDAIRDARLAVCGLARDADDARLLLNMLGIGDEPTDSTEAGDL